MDATGGEALLSPPKPQPKLETVPEPAPIVTIPGYVEDQSYNSSDEERKNQTRWRAPLPPELESEDDDEYEPWDPENEDDSCPDPKDFPTLKNDENFEERAEQLRTLKYRLKGFLKRQDRKFHSVMGRGPFREFQEILYTRFEVRYLPFYALSLQSKWVAERDREIDLEGAGINPNWRPKNYSTEDSTDSEENDSDHRSTKNTRKPQSRARTSAKSTAGKSKPIPTKKRAKKQSKPDTDTADSTDEDSNESEDEVDSKSDHPKTKGKKPRVGAQSNKKSMGELSPVPAKKAKVSSSLKGSIKSRKQDTGSTSEESNESDWDSDDKEDKATKKKPKPRSKAQPSKKLKNKKEKSTHTQSRDPKEAKLYSLRNKSKKPSQKDASSATEDSTD